MATYTREVPLEKGKCALLVVDMQQHFAVPGRGFHADIDPSNIPESNAYFFRGLANNTIPAIQTLLSAFRSKPGGEVVYTYVECLTKDGRDQSLDYKCTGFLVPKGSPGAEIIDALKPRPDEIMIPKTSSSVFNSTNIEYVLRNLGVSQLLVTGIITNQCVEGAVRDAADKGFLVTVVPDACTAETQIDHDQSLKVMKGFARMSSPDDVVREIEDWPLA